jgi:hypothetical protein
MTATKLRTGQLALLAATILVSASAWAGKPPAPPAVAWVDLGPASGFLIDGNAVHYTPSPALQVKYYADNITPQDAANLRDVINTQFGLSGLSAVGNAVSQCDNPASGCSHASGASIQSGLYSNSFTSTVAYNYLAVHFGQGELLFHWAAPLAAGTVFEIGGLPRGLSNYRAYAGVSAVPEPGTYAMLLGGLGLLGMISRRRSAAKK